MTPKQLSISIVLYNTCIKKLKKNLAYTTASVIDAQEQGILSVCTLYFIDNASTSNYKNSYTHFIAQLPPETLSALTIKMITSDVNRGHGKGHNLAIENITSDYHLILNPDAYMDHDALTQAITYMNTHSNVGLLSPAIRGLDGERHYLCREFPNVIDAVLRIIPSTIIKNSCKKRMHSYEMRDQNYDDDMINVPSLSGCYMFTRTAILKKIRGFDPRFFLYYDDTDLTRKLLSVSETAYIPSVKIIHEWQAGSHHHLKLLLLHIRDAFRYFLKWGGWLKKTRT